MCSRIQVLSAHLGLVSTSINAKASLTQSNCAAPDQFRLSGKVIVVCLQHTLCGAQSLSVLLFQVAVVTGAGSGIGKASALLFAEHGAKVRKR